jgi:hypothetical protein
MLRVLLVHSAWSKLGGYLAFGVADERQHVLPCAGLESFGGSKFKMRGMRGTIEGTTNKWTGNFECLANNYQ